MKRSLEYQTAEDLAARCYERAGFKILERNRRCIGAELDLIAYRALVLHFVEVKLRPALPTRSGEICELLSFRKKQALLRGALHYLERTPEIPPWQTMVLDLMVVTHEGLVRRFGNMDLQDKDPEMGKGRGDPTTRRNKKFYELKS